MRPDARPQVWKNRKRIRGNTLRIFSRRERRRWPWIVRRSRTVNAGQVPRLGPPVRMNALIVQDTKAGAVLSVHIQPRSSATECVGIHGDAIKIRVAAPPVDGAANDELIRFLACQLSIPSTSVRIHSGRGGRHKRVLIKGATVQLVMARLNLGQQRGPAKP